MYTDFSLQNGSHLNHVMTAYAASTCVAELYVEIEKGAESACTYFQTSSSSPALGSKNSDVELHHGEQLKSRQVTYR